MKILLIFCWVFLGMQAHYLAYFTLNTAITLRQWFFSAYASLSILLGPFTFIALLLSEKDYEK